MDSAGNYDAASALYSRRDRQMEWWYYSGHLESAAGLLSFCLALFRCRMPPLGVAWPVRAMTGWLLPRQNYAGHFSLVEHATRRFRYAHRRAIRGSSGAGVDRYRVWCGDWSAEAVGRRHSLSAAMRGARLALTLEPGKPLVLHGRDGWIGKGGGQEGFHASLTRLTASGQITLDGVTRPVAGLVSLDRAFGDWAPQDDMYAWDWSRMHLPDGRDVMVYVMCDKQGRPTPWSLATLVEADGSARQFPLEGFDWAARGKWCSPHSGACYSCGWRLRIAELAADLEIVPVCPQQEIDSRGSTMVVYWEGAAGVRGQFGGRDVSGRAYVELFGRGPSHTRLTCWSWLCGERWRQRSGNGVTVGPDGAGFPATVRTSVRASEDPLEGR